MSPGDPHQRTRLLVTLATPDGPVAAGRGLAVWLSRAAPASARGEVTVALVSDSRMRSLNRAYRGQAYATDVLSFPAAPPARSASSTGRSTRGTPPRFLGDVVIAGGVARRQAIEARHALGTELRLLALHGLLHLLGYDHETDNGRMARLEARLRKKAGLDHGLIERAR